MRARHRHFNPKDAGAVLVLDSRFISGLSDGNPVSTWADRSGNGNNATQSGAARPTFKTNEQGGQAALNFDGSNDRLSLATALTQTQSRTIISTQKRIGSIAIALGTSEGATGAYSIFTISGLSYLATNTTFAISTILIPTSWSVVSDIINDNTTFTGYINSLAFGLTVSGSQSGSSFNYVGSRGDNYASSAMGSVVFMPFACTNSLRRRLEHAAAYSFKIACS